MIGSLNGLSSTSSFDRILGQSKLKKAESTDKTSVLSGVAETDEATEGQLQATAKAPITDVVEISAEGRAAVAAQQAQTVEEETLTQSQQSQTLTNGKTAIQSIEQESSEETSSSVYLGNLSEDEISELVENGTITQAEANMELAKRAAEEAAVKKSENSPPPPPPETEDELEVSDDEVAMGKPENSPPPPPPETKDETKILDE